MKIMFGLGNSQKKQQEKAQKTKEKYWDELERDTLPYCLHFEEQYKDSLKNSNIELIPFTNNFDKEFSKE